MTIEERIEELFELVGDGDLYRYEASEKVVELTDEFTIGFALWKETNAEQNENGLYYGESRIQVSRHNPITIDRLLEIYKEQKGL